MAGAKLQKSEIEPILSDPASVFCIRERLSTIGMGGGETIDAATVMPALAELTGHWTRSGPTKQGTHW